MLARRPKWRAAAPPTSHRHCKQKSRCEAGGAKQRACAAGGGVYVMLSAGAACPTLSRLLGGHTHSSTSSRLHMLRAALTSLSWKLVHINQHHVNGQLVHINQHHAQRLSLRGPPGGRMRCTNTRGAHLCGRCAHAASAARSACTCRALSGAVQHGAAQKRFKTGHRRKPPRLPLVSGVVCSCVGQQVWLRARPVNKTTANKTRHARACSRLTHSRERDVHAVTCGHACCQAHV